MTARPSAWPVLVLLIGLVATAAGVRAGLAAREAADEAEFDASAARMAEAIEDRLTRPRYGLAGARGVAASLGRLPDVQEFRRYVRSRHLEREFPGVVGLGLIEPVHRDAVDAFEVSMTAQHGSDFQVHGESPHEWRYVIRSIEPLEPNRAALGFDTGSEPNRHAALQRSSQRGEPAATAPVTLRQDVRQRPGALYLLPVFASGGAMRAVCRQRFAAFRTYKSPPTDQQSPRSS